MNRGIQHSGVYHYEIVFEMHIETITANFDMHLPSVPSPIKPGRVAKHEHSFGDQVMLAKLSAPITIDGFAPIHLCKLTRPTATTASWLRSHNHP